MSRHYLTVDLGTGSTRLALVASGGEILGIKAFQNTYYRDDAYEDAQYFRPREWREKLLECCSALCGMFPDVPVDAVTAAGARQSFVLFDADGNDFLGLPNIDNRGRAFVGAIPEKQELYRLSGKWVTEDFGAAKLLGLRKTRPELYARVARLTSVSEWVAAIFTGKIVIEPSQACETQLYDIGGKRWSPELCATFGVDAALLPELRPAGAPVGPILPEYRARFRMADDAVFILGGADTQAALLQTGMGLGEIAVVSGTTSPVVTLTKEKFCDPDQRVWTDAGLGGSTYQIEMNPGVTGLNYQRMKDLLCPDRTYEALEEDYARKTDFRCTASFTSLLFYERRSLRRGGFFMRAPLDAAVDRTDLLWAVQADIACATYEEFRRLAELTGNRSPELLGCGGGFRSGALCRMLADLTGRTLRLKPGFEQATVRGLASLCGAWFCEDAAAGEERELVLEPGQAPLIHRYYAQWLENRDRFCRTAEPAEE